MHKKQRGMCCRLKLAGEPGVAMGDIESVKRKMQRRDVCMDPLRRANRCAATGAARLAIWVSRVAVRCHQRMIGRMKL
jgi:hypothetical protein